MAKQIIFNDDARKKLKKGIDQVADAVKITMGPRGRNVALDKGYGSPTVTNDGVSIAKEITLADKIENMGAEIIKEVAVKTNEIAGDGTTTAVVLTQAIIAEGVRPVAMGVNPVLIRHGIEDAVADSVAELKSISKPIKSDAEIKQVATISAESAELGTIIANTIKKVGTDGVVTVEESQSIGVTSDVAEGMQFDKGYVSAYMVTNSERMEAEYRDVAILLTDKKISTIKEILPLLEKIAQSGKKELVIIADDVDGEALTTFVLNKLRGSFSVLGIKAPGYGDRKKEMLQDIAVTIGAAVISDDLGIKLETAELDVLGKATKIIAKKDTTIVVGGKGRKSEIADRTAQLKKQIELSTSKYDKEKLQERIAKLSGGVAIIRVGAATETEMKYLKLKIEDAVNATKAAIDEGIVIGGGAALAKVANKLSSRVDALIKKSDKGQEYAMGYKILRDSLTKPLTQILINAGLDVESALVVQRVMNDGVDADSKGARKANFGYDALKQTYVDDLFVVGIIDPVKVTRTALQNAASAAAIFLTTEVAIAEEPKPEPPMPPHQHGMEGMGY